jgi:VanZ family protein
MRQEHRRWLWWLAVALWTAVIFHFSSSQFSKASTSPLLVQMLRSLFPAMTAETERILEFLVRKGAHVSEYAVLAVLAHQALRDSPNSWRSAARALVLVAAVALVDEIHQLFVVGRSGSVRDVFIDVGGGTAALLLVVCISRRFRREAPG